MFDKNYALNENIVRFLVDECGKENVFFAMKVPVPDGMNIDEDILVDDFVEDFQKRDELYEHLQAYLSNNSIGSDPELRKKVDQIEIRVNSNEKQLSKHEERIGVVESEVKAIHSLVKEIQLKFNSKFEEIKNEIKDGQMEVQDRFDDLMYSANVRDQEEERRHNDQAAKTEELVETNRTILKLLQQKI